MKTNFGPPVSHPIRTRSEVRRTIGALTVLTLVAAFSADAVIVAPYALDSDTLHLWHLDESTVPAADAAVGGTNLTVLGYSATLGNASYAGFGTALSTASSNASYLAASQIELSTTANNVPITYAEAATGAFTVEAVVRFDADPTTTTNIQYSIITTENDGSRSPVMFQFRVLPIGSAGGGLTTQVRLQFFNANGNTSTTLPLPTSGLDAVVQGVWYHAAATWDGAVATGGGGVLSLYWTRLDQSPSPVQASLLGTGTINNLNPIAAGAPELALGNHGRGTPGRASWPGLIDEVRLSKGVRHPKKMLFSPERGRNHYLAHLPRVPMRGNPSVCACSRRARHR